MSLTKVHSRMIEGDYANVKDFGAIGDGVADDSAAVQAALAAADRIYFPAGDYEIKSIAIDGFYKEIYAPTGAHLKNSFGDTSNMFDIAQTSDVQFLKINIDRITMSVDGGHIFRCFGTLNHSQINADNVDHNALDKSIIYVNDTNFYFNKISGLFWRISTSHTQPAIRLWSTSNKISANEFNILRPDRSGSRHFMELLSTSASDYNYSNRIRLSNPEVCDGGVLKLQRTFNTVVDRMHCFDTGTTTNHMIQVGSTGYVSQNTKIRDYQRNGGTLGSGKVDIFLAEVNHTYIEAPSGVSAGTIIEIDVNSEPNTTIIGGSWLNISNTTANTVILNSDTGLTVPNVIVPLQTTRLEIASGAITVTDSVHYVDTESLAATDDLDTINGGTDGKVLILRSYVSARDTTVKDATGNINLAGDFTLSSDLDTLTLRYDSDLSSWVELSRSNNA